MQLGRYTVQKRLASGGMAQVYLAQIDGAMGFTKTVVIKRIHAHLAEDPGLVDMFRSEAVLASRLDHPNLVHVSDFGVEAGAPYLVMEHVDGCTLSALLNASLAAHGPLAAPLAAKIISYACEGLAYAHELKDAAGQPLGLVHRDIS